MTTRRTTAPPSTMAPGGTATATPPTLMASTCAVSTPPMRTALSGPPGLAGSTLSSSPRWRYDLPVTQRTNEKDKRRSISFWNITNHDFWQLGEVTCLDIFFFPLKLTSLSLVDSAVCLLMSLSLFCSSSSITQLLVQCWLPLSFPLVPFSKKKKRKIIMPPSSLYFILSFSSQKQHTRAPNSLLR